MRTSLEVVESASDHAFGIWRSAVLYVWRGTTTAEAAHRMGQAMERVRQEAPEGPGLLLGVVEAGTPPPRSDAKTVLARNLRGGEGFVRASALVFEGQGFAASMVRGVATGLALLAGVSFPHKVFANVDAGATWLENQQANIGVGGSPITASEIAGKLQELRAAAHR